MPEFGALLSSEGEMAQRIRAFDWGSTPLGVLRDWPQSLHSALSICLNSGIASAIYWGPDLRLIYNDAWSAIPGQRHPWALGRPGSEVWHERWHIVGPQLESVQQGMAFVMRDYHLPLQRPGFLEETYWDCSFSPIVGEQGTVVGILTQGWETTDRVFAERRQRLTLAISDRARNLETPREIAQAAVTLISEHLSIDSITYTEIVPDSNLARIDASYASPPLSPLQGVVFLGDLGDDLDKALQHNRCFTVSDVDGQSSGSFEPNDRIWNRAAGGSLAAIPVFFDGALKAILFARHCKPLDWGEARLDLMKTVANRLWRELNRSRTEMALRESERRLRLIFEQARDFIFTTNLDQIISDCNPAAAEAIGLPTEEIIGRSIAQFVAPDEFKRTSSMLRHKLAEGGTTRYEVAVKTASGMTRQWDINSALTIDVDGRPIGLHAVARDITEKRAFDEQQQLLIDELNHRVKNTLALVQGLALQSFKSDRSLSEGQEAFQSRLAMLSAGHDLLTRAKWKGASLHHLVHDATAPYRDAPDRIAIEGPALELTPKQAISFVLALHELVTNAAKHGALSEADGRVAISWSLTGDREFDFEWRERGGPPVVEPPRRGFGLRMLERALASDLSGTADVEFASAGVICRISATLADSQ